MMKANIQNYISGVLLFLIVATSGCVTSSISSNKSPDFNQKITRLYLVIRSSKGAKEFSYSFKTEFLRTLSSRGIVTDYEVLDELALESDKDLTDKISNFGPQVVMVMNQTESKSNAGQTFGASHNISGGTFDIKLLLPASDKPVWRASLDAYGDSGIEAAVDKSVRNLVTKLTEDGLI